MEANLRRRSSIRLGKAHDQQIIFFPAKDHAILHVLLCLCREMIVSMFFPIRYKGKNVLGRRKLSP